MDITTLVRLAQSFADLGGAVQEQAHTLLESAYADEGDDTTTRVNRNAARLIADWADHAARAGVLDADDLYRLATEIAAD